MIIKPAVFQPTLAQYLVVIVADPHYEKTAGYAEWNRWKFPVIGMGKRADDSISQWEACCYFRGELVIATSIPDYEGIIPGTL